MFGFLRAKRCQLTDEQKALYSAHFCAGCHALAELGGRTASLLTNYDYTVMLLVAGAFEPEQPIQSAPCTAFAPRRITVQPLSAETRRRVAALNLALIEAKLRDDVEDEGKLSARAAQGIYRTRFEKARAELVRAGFPYAVFDTLGARQREVEARSGATLDDLAEPTAALLATVFAALGHAHDGLRALGRALGRFLYGWDALTDEAEDRRQGRFNAIRSTGLSRDEVRQWLTRELADFRRALAVLPLGERRPLLMAVSAHLRDNLERVVPPPARARVPSVRHRFRRQAGAGDCDCDCGGADCCSGTDCSGCDGCGECCGRCACDTCCDTICCGPSRQSPCCGPSEPSPCCGPSYGRQRSSCSCGGVLVLLIILAIILVAIYYINERHQQQYVPPPPPPRSVQTPASRPTAPSRSPNGADWR